MAVYAVLQQLIQQNETMNYVIQRVIESEEALDHVVQWLCEGWEFCLNAAVGSWLRVMGRGKAYFRSRRRISDRLRESDQWW